MSHRFPPLRPPADTGLKGAVRTQATAGIPFADLCLAAALALSLAMALI